MIVERWPERMARYRHILKQHLVYKMVSRDWQKPAREARDRHLGGKCFIFATGPSVNRIDLDKVEYHVKREEYGVIGVNSFNSSELAKRFPPDYVMISDPCYLDEPEDSKYKSKLTHDIERIKSLKASTLILPHQWAERVERGGLFPEQKKVYFFNCENTKSAGTGCDLLGVRYYISMTAYKAVVAAAHLGFRELYLLGYDEDQISGLSIDIKNHVIWQDRHFYADDPAYSNRDMTVEYGMTYDSFCANVIRSCESQRKINNDVISIGGQVWNCNPSSFVVGFQKTDRFQLAENRL